MKSYFTFLLLLLVLGSHGPLSAAEDSRATDYQQINALIDHITNKSSSPYVEVDQSVVINSDKTDQELSFSDIRIWVSLEDEVLHEVPIDDDGVIQLPLLDEKIAELAKLNVNQDADRVSISLSIGVITPTEKQVPYKQLFVLLEDTNSFISEMAGGFSWLTPSMDDLKFTFENPATISIKTKKKTYQYKTNKDNVISISIKKRLMKENPMVIFSELPIEMSPED